MKMLTIPDKNPDIVHVYPTDDEREHVTEGYPQAKCWCEPEVETEDGGLVLIHRRLQ